MWHNFDFNSTAEIPSEMRIYDSKSVEKSRHYTHLQSIHQIEMKCNNAHCENAALDIDLCSILIKWDELSIFRSINQNGSELIENKTCNWFRKIAINGDLVRGIYLCTYIWSVWWKSNNSSEDDVLLSTQRICHQLSSNWI